MFGLSDLVTKIIAGSLVAVVATLGVMLAIKSHDASHFRKLYEQQTKLTADASSKLDISNASIGRLQSDLAEMTAQSEARAKEYADTKAEDAQRIADMDRRQKSDASRIDTLKHLAATLPDQPGCKVPTAVAAQLEGL